MNRKWRDFLYLSKTDRTVLVFVVGVLVGVVAVTSLWWCANGYDTPVAPEAAFEQVELWGIDTMSPRSSREPATDTGRGEEMMLPVETFDFDPNTADSATFRRLGLSARQARSICRYRAKGGAFHRPEDFAKVYALTQGDYHRLRPHIRIADRYCLMADVKVETAGPDTLKPRRALKYSEGVVIELNAADTTELMKIPGIGNYRARLIADYRERLGGFVSVEQLSEIEQLPSGFEQWFEVQTGVFRPLYLNRLKLGALMRHPYLNFHQAKVICDHRRKNGPIHSLKELSCYEEFASGDLERLVPYVSFDE